MFLSGIRQLGSRLPAAAAQTLPIGLHLGSEDGQLDLLVIDLSCEFRVTDGWFDDPIGLSARACILVPPIALSKSLLARLHFIPWINFSPIPELTHCHPIGYYSAFPSHTLTPHSGTSMALRSTLTRCTMIGRLNHGPLFPPVLFLL